MKQYLIIMTLVMLALMSHAQVFEKLGVPVKLGGMGLVPVAFFIDFVWTVEESEA